MNELPLTTSYDEALERRARQLLDYVDIVTEPDPVRWIAYETWRSRFLYPEHNPFR